MRCIGIVLSLFVGLFIGPRRPLSEDDKLALVARAETIALVKVLHGGERAVPVGFGCNRSFTLHRELEFEVVDVLKGSLRHARFTADGGALVEGIDPERLAALRDHWALILVVVRGSRVYLPNTPDLPGRGVLAPLDGPGDPRIEAVRAAIRRTSLDSLTTNAECICLGLRPRMKRDHGKLFVTEWIAGAMRADTLNVLWPYGAFPKADTVLIFLAKNPRGELEPLGMGAGEMEVNQGRVLDLDLPLDEVLRQVRARRFVVEARALAENRAPIPTHRDHP